MQLDGSILLNGTPESRLAVVTIADSRLDDRVSLSCEVKADGQGAPSVPSAPSGKGDEEEDE